MTMKEKSFIKNSKGGMSIWFIVIFAVVTPIAYFGYMAQSNLSNVVEQARSALDLALLSTEAYTKKSIVIGADGEQTAVCTYDQYSSEDAIGLERYWNMNRYHFFEEINGYNDYWYIPYYGGYVENGKEHTGSTGFYFNRVTGVITVRIRVVMPANVFISDYNSAFSGFKGNFTNYEADSLSSGADDVTGLHHPYQGFDSKPDATPSNGSPNYNLIPVNQGTQSGGPDVSKSPSAAQVFGNGYIDWVIEATLQCKDITTK
jgi:hypothetical protein